MIRRIAVETRELQIRVLEVPRRLFDTERRQ